MLRQPMPEREAPSGNRAGPSVVVLRDHKAEMFLHRREIAVIVQ